MRSAHLAKREYATGGPGALSAGRPDLGTE
jgi:hypothetical protein